MDAAAGQPGGEMSFMDHLAELRKRIVLAVIGVVAGSILTGIFSDQIMKYLLLYPATHTQPPITLLNLKPYGLLTIYMQVIVISGVIVAIPWILYQFWLFVAPGLHAHERRWVKWITFFTALCFLAGIAFAFFVALPYMLNFFSAFTPTETVENKWSINDYMTTVVGAIATGGIIFELPMLAYFLGRLGILTPQFMLRYWRHAVVVILIAAAIITPTLDPLTQLVFSVPLTLLYAVSIWVVHLAHRTRMRRRTEGAA